MSIDKASSGFPEVNVHKRTTKVNLSVIVGVLIFLIAGMAAAFWMSRNTPQSEGAAPTAAEKK